MLDVKIISYLREDIQMQIQGLSGRVLALFFFVTFWVGLSSQGSFKRSVMDKKAEKVRKSMVLLMDQPLNKVMLKLSLESVKNKGWTPSVLVDACDNFEIASFLIRTDKDFAELYKKDPSLFVLSLALYSICTSNHRVEGGDVSISLPSKRTLIKLGFVTATFVVLCGLYILAINKSDGELGLGGRVGGLNVPVSILRRGSKAIVDYIRGRRVFSDSSR